MIRSSLQRRWKGLRYKSHDLLVICGLCVLGG